MESTHFKKLLCSAFMLVFLVGCGKDNSSGGSKSGGGTSSNPISVPDLPSTSTDQFNRLKSWYTSTAQHGLPNVAGSRIEKRAYLDYSSVTNECKTKTLLGFIDINYCFNNESIKPTIKERTVHVVLGGNKSLNNENLRRVFSPPSGYIFDKVIEASSPINSRARLYTVDYIKPNKHILRFKIDTGLNSAFNPVEIYDTETKKVEYVYNPIELIY